MRFSSWLSLGIGVGVVFAAACGGGVSLGRESGELAAGDGGTSDGRAECADKSACGPAPALFQQCADGTTGGSTGRCLKLPDGSCGWEVRKCPEPDAGSGADCFDSSGSLLDSYKSCTTADDCVVIDVQQDCCGAMNAEGVAKTSQAAVEQCAAARTASFPGCGCAPTSSAADDGTTDPTFAAKAQVTCRNNKCESTYKGEACGTHICTANQTCCGPMPLPEATCVEGANSPCPISQRKMKKDITYLSEDDKQRMSESLMSFPLATYRYKTEGPEQTPHLGFIIDDVAPSPAVLQSGERVDLYGYSTMTVATLQVQAKEIAELRKQVDTLRRECVKKAAPKR